MSDTRSHRLPDGREVVSHTLRNAQGAAVTFLDLGGCVTAIEVPDRHGKFGNIVLGYDSPAGYDSNETFFGALVGRYANRMAKGRFTLDGTTYQMPVTEGGNALHSAPDGFNRQIWQVERFNGPHGVSARLTHRSPAGHGGFPGRVEVEVVYSFDDAQNFRMTFNARTDAPTVLNLTSHGYFNLDGEGAGNALGQSIQIDADYFLPVDAAQLPTGERAAVAGTPMDFRTLQRIDARIAEDYPQLREAGGYDHCWVLNKPAPGALTLAARAESAVSGRWLELATTEPGLQFYSGVKLDGSVMGPSGHGYRKGDGYAFEAQHFPDAPNHPGFPSTVLYPGQDFSAETVFRFGVTQG
ncbi:MAG: galactose-1-epimerase [Rhodospirillales bacterium 20-64-7]|nr:MAG: galactose-1-epimerase [Rhodospirillales bacterium 20-64-7]